MDSKIDVSKTIEKMLNMQVNKELCKDDGEIKPLIELLNRYGIIGFDAIRLLNELIFVINLYYSSDDGGQ